jgi:hypothetical protein
VQVTEWVVALGTFVGSAAASFWGGRKGAHKLGDAVIRLGAEVKRLRRTVITIHRRVRGIEERLGIPHTPKPKNGKVAQTEIGLVGPIDGHAHKAKERN